MMTEEEVVGCVMSDEEVTEGAVVPVDPGGTPPWLVVVARSPQAAPNKPRTTTRTTERTLLNLISKSSSTEDR